MKLRFPQRDMMHEIADLPAIAVDLGFGGGRTCGITNADLEALFVAEMPAITAAFATYDYLKLTRTTPIFHS